MNTRFMVTVKIGRPEAHYQTKITDMKIIHNNLFFLSLFVGLFLSSPASASVTHRVRTEPPPPRLLLPNEELSILNGEPAEFRWSQDLYLRSGGFYDFRIYEGSKQVQSTLIFKSRVPSNKHSIQVSADFFRDGKLYAWSIRSVTPHGKSRSNYSVFRVKIQDRKEVR